MHPPAHRRLSSRAPHALLALAFLGPALLAVAVFVPGAARADDPPAPSVRPAGQSPDLTAPMPRPPPGLDFDLLDPAAAATPTSPVDAEFARRVERRRTMLKLHQGLGIATWASLGATVVIGQLEFNDRFRGGGDTGKWLNPHRALAATTATLFATTGLLGVLAPEPYQKRSGRLDSAKVHKISMGVATAGMVAEIVLGIMARGKAGSVRERDLAGVHQVLGYTTFGAMTVGATALVF